MDRRTALLLKLAKFEEPSAPLIEELRHLGWDWSGDPLLVLDAEHFLNIMDRFLSGELSAELVEEWAENLESREDVGFATGREDLLDDMLFCLANPSINYEISRESILVSSDSDCLRANNSFKPSPLRGPA